MKRFVAVLLAVALLTCVALAEDIALVNSYVERQGYKVASVRNKSGLVGCWYVEGADTDTLQWSDTGRIYTVSDRADSDLRALYGELVGMAEWDTCSYAAGDRVLFSYNAPEITTGKSYKTLKNYAKYLGEYLEKQQPVTAPAKKKGRQTYIVNKSTKKFHLEDCSTIKNMKKENREKYTGNRSDLIAQGYEPCKKCNP